MTDPEMPPVGGVTTTASVDRGRRRDLALIKAGVSAVVARAGSSLTTLLLTPVLARILGIESFGVLLTLTAASSLLLLGNLGVASGLVSRLAASDGDPARARAVLSSAYAVVVVASLVGLVVAAVLAVVLPWSSWASSSDVSAADIRLCAFIAMAGTALQMTMTLGQQIELSRQRGHAAAWWLGAANIGAPAMATVLAVATDDLRWTIAGMALTPPLVMAVQSYGVLRRIPAEQKPVRSAVSGAMVRELLSSGLHFTGIAVLGAMAFQLDILIVSAFLGSEAAAQYGVTARLFALLATTLQIAVTQLWSAFADARRHGDIVWIRRTLIRTTVACGAVGVTFSVLLMLIGEPLIRLWVGPDFVPPTPLLVAAAVWTAMVSTAAPLVFFLNGSEKERQQFLLSIPMAVANLGLSIWLVQTIGISGVVWASCVSWLAFVLVPLVVIARRTLGVQQEQSAALVQAELEAEAQAVAAGTDLSHLPDERTDAEGTADGRRRRRKATGDASGYRADIDGLRAVAVLSVLGFHFFPGTFRGGFVGVDVFFVVSGYLITGLMVRRMGTGVFTMRDFYARRVRRIFPALGLVLVVTMVVGWVVLFADEFKDLAQQAASGAFFVANFHFMQQSSYFDADAYSKPLLHLWSLAIEEQFYLVWPVVILFALRRGRRTAVVAVAVITVVSLLANLYLASNDPAAAYYSPVSRFWQLSAGGLLALVFMGRTMRGAFVATVTSLLGLLMIAYAVLTFGSSLAYPGVYGIVPVLGTLAIMQAGPASWLNRGPLSWRLAVGIGLISYPLYLWHWPLISFATIVGKQFPPITTRLGLVLIAFVLAILTYRLVERPLRRGPTAARAARPLTAGIVAVGLTSALVLTPIGPTSAHSDTSGSLGDLRSWPYETNQLCNDRYPFEEKVGGWWFCETNADRDPDILLLGDSVANELYPGMVDAYPDSTVLSIGTCSPTQGLVIRPIAAAPGNPCFQPRSVAQEEFIDRTIADLKAPWVVVTGVWPRFDDAGDWVTPAGQPAGSIAERSAADGASTTDRAALVDGLNRRVESIEQAGGRVVLVGPKPQIPYDIAQCFPRPFNDSIQSCEIPRTEEREAYASFASIAADIVREHPEVRVFDQTSVYCDAETCSFRRGDTPLVRDLLHASVDGSELVGRDFATWARSQLPEFGRR